MGANEDDIQRWLAERNAQTPDRSTIRILPENEAAVRLFLSAATQWRIAGMAGVPVGLDYAGVEGTARCLGLAMTPDLFQDIRAMEAAALEAFPSRR